MPLSQKEAAKFLKGLHHSNKQYFVEMFNLTEAEADFLLEAWKTYAKGHAQELKNHPFRFLDSFIHGYLAHFEFVHAKQTLPFTARVATPKQGESQALDC